MKNWIDITWNNLVAVDGVDEASVVMVTVHVQLPQIGRGQQQAAVLRHYFTQLLGPHSLHVQADVSKSRWTKNHPFTLTISSLPMLNINTKKLRNYNDCNVLVYFYYLKNLYKFID